MDMWKNIERLKAGLTGDVPKFGSGRPCKEAECDEIKVSMVCYGQATAEKRRLIVPKDTTLEAMKASFGRPMGQEVICDENYFIFNDGDLKKPVYMFSNKCNLNLYFCFDSHVDELKKKLAVDEIKKKVSFKGLCDWTKSKL